MKISSMNIILLSLFVAYTKAVYVATDLGLCMSYFNAVAGARPKFAPCDPNDSRQTSWTATAAGGTAPAGALVFCTSGGTLCSSANAQTGVVTLQTRNGNDPAQQWSSLPGGASGQFTNGAAGIGNCAQAGLKLVVKPCDPSSGMQQFYTYGPTTTARMATQDYFKHLLVRKKVKFQKILLVVLVVPPHHHPLHLVVLILIALIHRRRTLRFLQNLLLSRFAGHTNLWILSYGPPM